MADTQIDPRLVDAYSNAPSLDQVTRNLRVIGGHIVEGAASAPALPTDLYSLIDLGLKKLRGGDVPVLPGTEGAASFSDTIHENANQWGGSVAGEELKPGLLSNEDPIHQISNAASILINPLPVAGPALKVVKGIKEFSTGIKALDVAKNAAINSLAVASPVIPTSHVVGMMAANATIGTAANVASEMMASSEPQVIAQGDAVADASVSQPQIDRFKVGTEQAIISLDDYLKKATDQSVAGYQTSVEGHKELDDVIRGMASSADTFDVNDYLKAAGIAAGTALAATVAYKVHNAKAGKIVEAFGGSELSKRSTSGVEGAVSKPDASILSAGDVAGAQAFDASIPLRRMSDNPELMGAKFERVVADPHGRMTTLMEDGSIGGDSHVTLNTPGKNIVAKVQELGKDADALNLLRTAMVDVAEQSNRVSAWLDKVDNPSLKKLAVNDPVAVSEYERWLSTSKAARDPAAVERQYSFHKEDTPFATLKDTVDQARSNPQIAEIMDDFKDVSRKMLDYRLEQGVITKTEYGDLLRKHPEYYALPIEGSHMQSLELSKAGGRMMPGDPISELMPYTSQTFKEVAHEKLKTAAILEQLDKRASGNKYSAQLLGKSLNPNTLNQYTREKAIVYRDAAGIRRAIEITDPTYRMALRGDAGSGQLRLNEGWVKFASAPSRLLEWATTGPASALFGSPFAIANAAYGAVATLVNRPKGTSAGIFDKGMQRLSGGKFGVRADPTFVAQTVYQAGENVVAVLAKYAAKAIENVATNHSMHSGSGPGTLDAMGKSLSSFYKRTVLHDLETRGLRGGATPMYQAKAQTMADIEASMSPVTRASKGWTTARDFIHDIFGAVGNAPQGTFFKQNKGLMSDELLTTRTRNVMGDPSKSGLAKSNFGKGVGGAIVISPWGGVTVQATKRFLQAWKENPLGTATAIFGTVAIPSMMITKWNMSLGPEYLDYQMLQRTPDQASGSFYVGIPGRPPQEGVEIRLDQPMRPFKVLVDTLFGHQFGMYDGSIFDPKNELVKQALQAGISERYGIWGSAMKSAAGQLAPAIPPALNAANIAMGGSEVGRTYVDAPTRIVENRNRGASDSTSSHIDNKLFGYNVSAEMEAMVSAIGGQVGRGIYETLTGIAQGKKDSLSASDIRSDFTDRFGQRISQANREIAPIWGHAQVMSPSQEATAQALRPKIDGIKKLDAASEKLRSLSGSGAELSGGRGREINALVGEGPVKFADQQMYALARNAQVFMRQYNNTISGQLKDLYEQRASVQSSAHYTPDTKTEVLNDITKKIVDTNRRGMSMVKQWEWGMSKAYNRTIDISKIKLGDPITQFQELL